MIQYFQTKTTATWANFCVEKEGELEKDLKIVSRKNYYSFRSYPSHFSKKIIIRDLAQVKLSYGYHIYKIADRK